MKTVWVNGCFDVLHREHVQLLRYAASLGDKLIVAIDSDKKVKLDKWSTRPYNSQEDRKYFLASIRYVDEVLIFNSKDELKNFSVGIVSTMLRTDLRIALSFFKIGRSFVIGWGKNDKLMSLNSLETRLIAMN